MKIRIATWNISYANDLSAILNAIRYQDEFKDIDIFALQEGAMHNGHEDAFYIAKALGKDYAYFQGTTQQGKDLIQANALVWNTKRVKVKKKEIITLPNYKTAPLGAIEKTFKALTHKEKKNSVMIEGNIDNTTFRMYGSHFDVLAMKLRTLQLQKLLDHHISREPVEIACIAGDLNTFKIIKRPKWTDLHAAAKAHNFIDITTDIQWTFRHLKFRYRQKLDSIFMQKNKQMHFTSWSVNVKGSDHIPIFANIDL
jgi:endonuclease/exonuclease/phosphatase family metal-dependent hydrolase